MGYLGELESFFCHIQNNSSRSLSRKQLIEDFLQYMSQEYGYSQEYFLESFNENSVEFNDFDEFIYQYYMSLSGDLRIEYENEKEVAKERIKLYKERVHDLHSKVDAISPDEKYKRQKYIFFRNINEELLKKATESRKKEKIFWKALAKCRKASTIFECWSCYDEFRDIQQDVEVDWKLKINFLEAAVVYVAKLAKMKKTDNEQYVSLFKQYIDKQNILEELLKIASNNYYLKDRKEIIREAAILFEKGKYIPFVYLLVPQVEGLFDVYKKLLGINNNKQANGLIEKVNMINEHQRLWGYVYYAFDFPVLRNDIAHGNMVNITSEIAFDTLMDISYLFHEIEDADMEYKLILDFLNTFSCKPVDDDNNSYILGCFSNSTKSEENLEWLKKCYDGDYDSMLRWYNRVDAFNKLKEYFMST